ncbi:MAG TPA: hypothetical protein PKV71_12245, partial [Calditrichia bacterium]|nr:hypothetical protein [Calditrichia bacterium]
QFSFEGIRAILNVGSSSKEESSDIGKFGIGFKLVHRLIGENSAIEELTEQHLGPILFSWSKKKHLEKLRALRSLSEIEPVPQSYHAIARVDQERDSHQCGDPEPWLFKILVTNFPCQPGEEVHDINYQLTNSLFAEAELLTLVDWVNRKLPVNLDNFEQGSLFFLKLGPGKKRYLEGEYLEHGVKSSLSLLNKISEASHKKGLERVYLNAAEITHPSDLAYEKFVLPGGSRAHNYVRPRKGHFAEENAVEFLLGYCRDFHQSQSLIHGYPNFYLFFPILEEVHNLHFILHSNAFYNGSHRTSLHLGGESGEKDDYGINERLLEVFADQLIERLEQYRVGDRERFAAIYAALLLSGPANERHKKWVDKPLYQPLLAYLREHIPTQSQGENWCVRKESVRIKKTALKICLEDFGIHHVRWFYWDDPLLNREASLTNETGSEMSNSKLGLTAWNVVDVIEALPGDAEILAFGKWIASLERDDPATYQAFFAEINDGIGYNPSPGFIKTFFALPVFRFGDTFCSINDLAGPAAGDKLFCMEQTAGLRDILGILNIEMSSLNISDVRWRRVKFNIENRLPQLADGHPLLCLDDDARLLNYIQEAILKDPNGLSTEQKIRLFKTVLEGFDNALRDSIGNLRLFVNTLGELQPLHQMLPFQPENYPAWLTPFMIAASDYLPDEQRDHLVAPERIFGDVVVPNWERIIAGPNLPEQIADFYDEVGSLFRKSTGDVPTWDKRPFVYVDRERGFLTPDAVLFHPGLANLGEPEYQVVEKALRSLIGKPLPNFAIVSALRKAPFAGNFAAVDFGAEVGGSVDLTHRETVLLRDAVDGTGADFFEWFVVRATQVSDQYRVEPRGDKMQCFCSFKHPQLSRFIESDARLQDTLLFLPANLYEPRMDKTALLTGK